MASGAKVGALHVEMGMSTAQFETGIAKAEKGLDQFSAAAGRAGMAASRMADDAQKAAARTSAMTRNLSFQLIDIGQSIPLAFQSPIYALQNLGFQIAQIGQIYMGQGGMKAAFTDATKLVGTFITKFGPLAAIAGAVAGGFAALTGEINKTATTQVKFGDVFQATVQLAAESISNLLAPAISSIGGWLQQAWDFSMPILKGIANSIIGAFVGSFDAVKATWSQLPGAMGDLAYQAAQNVTNGVIYLVREAQTIINGFISNVNGMLRSMGSDMQIGQMGLLGYADFGNPFAGQAGEVGAAMGQAFSSAMGQDYAGAAFNAISERAQAIAGLRDETDKAAGSAGKLGKALTDAASAAKQEWDFYRSTFSGFFGDLKTGLSEGKSLWASFAGAASSALDSISSRLLDMAASGIFDMLFGGLFGGGGGGFGIGPARFAGPGGFFMSSFEGGGYTGSGARAGGMDGRGGFPAMLHPNETVVDHSKGDAAGGPTMNFYITGSRQDAAELAGAAKQAAMEVLETYQRNPYRK